jgi:quinol monooxygenase YgiN
MSQPIPPIAVLVSDHVANYDAWKKAFDGHQAARVQASCVGHHINRGADDPNTLHLYFPATDVDKLKAFVDSPELAEAMKAAGVDAPPTIRIMEPKEADFIPDQKVAGLIVAHEVEDYGTWKTGYDDTADLRKENGIIGHAVNTELGKPNHVLVYHQANDVETLRAFLDLPALQEAMRRAGVKGEPEIHLVQVADFANY